MEYFLREEGEKYDKAIREEGQKIADGTTQTAKTVGKLGYATAIELSGAGDIARINAGVDPYTGEELTNQKRFEEWAEWVATNGVVAGSHKINNIFGSIVKNGNDIKSVNNGYDKMEKNNGK